MALDEFLNNIISYAYKDDQHHAIQITSERVDDSVVITIIDDGIPFNPFTSAPPDTTAGIEERDVGGLGIHLVKEMMDEVSYQRRVNQNVVKITKWIADDTPNTKGEST
jgi:sigma-B regulation protein RsbU (phosphoserine phosphatase)